MMGGTCVHCDKILADISQDICEECYNTLNSQCSYCNMEQEPIYYEDDDIFCKIAIGSDNQLNLYIESVIDTAMGERPVFIFRRKIKINYCPMCGRELK